MKTPRYTDAHRWPHGYRKSDDTNIAETFQRVRQQQEAAAREAEKVVRPINRKSQEKR